MAVTSSPAQPGEITDANADATEYETDANQYLGTGTGIGGDVVVRVTMDGSAIGEVEVLQEDETPDVGGHAIKQLPPLFAGLTSAEEIEAVDAVSGATVTSNALKEAVSAALAQAS